MPLIFLERLILTISDTATNILNSDGFAIFASGDVTATGASHAQAVQLNVMADVDEIRYKAFTSFSNLSVDEASVLSEIKQTHWR